MKKLIVLILFFLISSCNEDDTEILLSARNDEGIVLNIPLSGSLQNPTFAPNGATILFTRFINGYNQEPAELYKYNLVTETLTLLMSDGSGNVNLPGSSWNDEINAIIFSSSREPHDEIYLITEFGSTGDEVQITDREDKVAYEPTLSPDGLWTVFESHNLDQEDNGIITKYKIDGTSEYIELTDNLEDCRQPNWSPENDKILYQKFKNGQWDIWLMNSDGEEHIQLTSGEGDKTDASFSADGQFIIYSSDFETELSNIYRITVDGGNPFKLTDYIGYDGAPSTSLDNKLIFESSLDNPDNSEGTKIILLNL